MRERAYKADIPSEHKIRRSAFVTVVGDVILIVALVVCLFTYISRNNIDTYNQNVETISNIASAQSGLMRIALDNASEEVKSAYSYCRGKSVKEILDYLSLVVDPQSEYQLLTLDEEVSTPLYHVYTGYSTKKNSGLYQWVEYEDTSLAESIFYYSSQEEGVISYSQSFTNDTDALRYFAVFCGVTVDEAGAERKYYLVKPQKENKLLDQLQPYSQYAELDLAICYTDGKYLASDNGFRAGNFYDYLYKYNDLSIDQRNAIRNSVQQDEDGVGELEYRDYQGRDCVFAYAVCSDAENWLVVVAVPTTEFDAGELVALFPMIIIIFLLVLLVFNSWRLLSIVGELRRSVERERIANSSKSSFLSRMSHEIRTPLNAIIGYNTIARTDMAEAKDEAQRKQAEMKVMDCLTKSETASKHLLSIINDVLDMSAIESGKIKIARDRFDFKALISSLTAIFYSQAQTKGVRFQVVFGELTEEWFVGDQMRVNQILTNLLSNAIKFTPEGGSVTLRIDQTEVTDNSTRIHFTVQDTGIGMTPEYLRRIWEPFEQADSSISRRFGGTGLGLSITKTLTELMGGEISVESTRGQGSAFSVELGFGRTAQPKNQKLYDFGGINALAVDDDQSTRDYISLLFERCRAKCTAVSSGEEAVRKAAAAIDRGEPYTLYLVDWRMDNMDGIETVRRIRALAGENMPIIVLTAYDFAVIADEASKAGVSKFISKPLFQSSLFDLLTDVSGIEPAKAGVDKTKEYDFTGSRVLLAEDNAMNMEIAKMLLMAVGFTVDGAWDGQEAVERFEASGPGDYQAVLMDVHMPRMDGYEASKAIRASVHPDGRTIPILAMTADVFADDVAEAHASGMDAHIAKPIDTPTLYETLARYIK